MASYEYVCAAGHPVIIERPMTEPEGEPTCVAPECSEKLTRVWGSPIAIFKGRGFYSTGG